MAPPALDRRPGPARRAPEWLNSRRRRQFGPGKGLEFNAAAEGAARVLDQRWSRLATAGGLSSPGWPGDLRPWGQGAPTCPGLMIHSVLQVTGLKPEQHVPARAVVDVHPLLLFPVSRQQAT